jgi:amino acid transporter
MSKEELENKLKQLDIEDFIWLIYIGIILMSWYSNSLERDFFVNNNEVSKTKYRNIIIIIFSVLVAVYAYFFKDSLDDVKNLKPTDTKKKRNLISISFIASTLILISGLMFLYIAIEDEELNVELAFN